MSQQCKIHNVTSNKKFQNRKKQKNTTHNEQVNQLIKTYKQPTEMLELRDRNTEMVIITVFNMFKK